MSSTVKWVLEVDETGAIKRMREFSKEVESADKSMGKTKKEAEDTGLSIKHLGDAFGGLKSVIGMAAGAIGLGGMAFGLKDVLERTTETAEATDNFSKFTGMSTQTSLDYVSAMKARGISTTQMGRAYKTLAKSVESAERQQYSFAVGQEKSRMQGRIFTTQIGAQAEAFQQLGISIGTFKGMSPEKQFEMLTEKLEKLHNGMRKAQIMSQLFGRGAQSMASAFSGGALGLTSMLKAAREYMPILHGGAKGQEELLATQMKAKLAWEGLQLTLGEKLAPAMEFVFKTFGNLMRQMESGKGVFGTLNHVLTDSYMVMKEVWDWLEHNAVAADAMGAAVGGLMAALAVEKVINFYRAVKSLTVIAKITELVKGLTAANDALAGSEAAAGAAAAGEAGGAAAGADAASAASASSAEGTLAEGGALGLGAATKALPGLMAAWAITSMIPTPKSLFGHELGHGGSLWNEGTKAILSPIFPEEAGNSEQQERAALAHAALVGPRATPAEMRREERRDEALTAPIERHQIPALHPIHVDLHMDGRKLAEAFVKNPSTSRYLAEAVERGALNRVARGHYHR